MPSDGLPIWARKASDIRGQEPANCEPGDCKLNKRILVYIEEIVAALLRLVTPAFSEV